MNFVTYARIAQYNAVPQSGSQRLLLECIDTKQLQSYSLKKTSSTSSSKLVVLCNQIVIY